jgi:hypothetical protein
MRAWAAIRVGRVPLSPLFAPAGADDARPWT